MKIKILFFFLFLLYASLKLAAQNKIIKGYILYESDNPGVKNRYMEMYFSTSEFRYALKGLDEANLTASLNRKFESAQDSIANSKNVAGMKQRLQNIPVNQWYAKPGSAEVVKVFYEPNTEKLYFTRDTLSFMKWTLMADTASINGLLCYKASGQYEGSKYIAWYAPSIPVSAAPFQFRGLPGLLIKSENTTKHISFHMKELQWPTADDLVIAPSFSKGQFISAAGLESILKKQGENFTRLMETIEKSKREGKQVNVYDLLKNNQ